MKTRKRFYFVTFVTLLATIQLFQSATMSTSVLAGNNIPFTEHTMADNFGHAQFVSATDLDDNEDALGAAIRDGDITWWENDGEENFSEHVIAGGFKDAYSVYATDRDWSNVQSVVATVQPTGPEPGHYTGTTPSVSFDVTSDQQVCSLDIRVPFSTGSCRIRPSSCAEIADNDFAFSAIEIGAIYEITGTFDTQTQASGSYRVSMCGSVIVIPASEGTWEASKYHSPALNIIKNVTGAGGDTQDLPLGGVITYTIALTNNKDDIASGVVMTDTLPDGVSFGGWLEQGLALLPPPGDTITWGPHDIPANDGYTIRFTATITTDSAFAGHTILNTAWFSSADAGSGSDAATFTIAPLPEPELSITKDVAGAGGDTHDLPLGGVITYTIALTNNEDGIARNVVMTDTLPDGVSFGGWLEQGSALLPPPDDTITWGPHDVPANDGYTICFTATITTDSAFAGYTVPNTAWFSSADAGSGSDAAIFTIAPSPEPELSITKDVAGAGGSTQDLPLGSVVTYTIVLVNSGEAIATGVVMTDDLSDGVSFGDWLEQGLALPSSGDRITWGPHDVPANDGYTIRFTATITTNNAFAGHTIPNIARFSSDDAGSGSDEATLTVAPINVYLPLVLNSHSATRPNILNGTVTDNSIPVAGTELLLRYYDGSSWSTCAATTTDASGHYQFANLPGLGTDQRFYVRWNNTDSNSNRLWRWVCRSITASTTDPDVYSCNFDLDNIDLLSPDPKATVSLPYTFAWRKRAITTDSYELNLADVNDDDPFWWTDPSLGYVDSYTLGSLPTGFVPGQQYGWWMWVYGPDGYGISYYYRSVTFSNAGNSAKVRNVPMSVISKENIEAIAPPQSQ